MDSANEKTISSWDMTIPPSFIPPVLPWPSELARYGVLSRRDFLQLSAAGVLLTQLPCAAAEVDDPTHLHDRFGGAPRMAGTHRPSPSPAPHASQHASQLRVSASDLSRRLEADTGKRAGLGRRLWDDQVQHLRHLHEEGVKDMTTLIVYSYFHVSGQPMPTAMQLDALVHMFKLAADIEGLPEHFDAILEPTVKPGYVQEQLLGQAQQIQPTALAPKPAPSKSRRNDMERDQVDRLLRDVTREMGRELAQRNYDRDQYRFEAARTRAHTA